MNSYQNVILYASWFSVLAPITVYLINIKKVKSEIHCIGMFVIVSGVSDVIGYTLVKQKLSTAFIINTFFLLQFFLLSHFYYRTLFLNKPNTAIVMTMVHYILGLLIVTLFYDAFGEQHQNSMWAISSAILIVYSILHYKEKIRTYWPPRLYRYGDFWINSAISLYLLLSIWLFAIRSDTFILQLSHEMYRLFSSFHRVNNALKNILLAVGIFYSMKRIVNTGIYLSK